MVEEFRLLTDEEHQNMIIQLPPEYLNPETIVTGVDGLRVLLNMIQLCWVQGLELRIEQTMRFKPSPDNKPLRITSEVQEVRSIENV